jgi:hypothetical protein
MARRQVSENAPTENKNAPAANEGNAAGALDRRCSERVAELICNLPLSDSAV